MSTAFKCVAKRTEFCTIRTQSYQTYIDEVTYPLCLTLQYEEVDKGSTMEDFPNSVKEWGIPPSAGMGMRNFAGVIFLFKCS